MRHQSKPRKLSDSQKGLFMLNVVPKIHENNKVPKNKN